ncbi:ATP-binding cassette sub-family A member 13 [Ciconia maguari]
MAAVREPGKDKEVLSLTEILWPCVLFLILAAIRFQEPPKYKENCYLEARDLPSRGLYPFMRTLFCNVGSRCKNTSYTTQKNNRLRTSGIQSGPESFTGLDLDFMKEIEELARGFIETTEKTMALEKLWEENSKFPESIGMENLSSSHLVTFRQTTPSRTKRMDLNEAEEIISRAENLYRQPYIWNLLHSLPHLESNSFYTEDGLAAIASFLKVIQNTLTSLKDLAVMPLGNTFYEMVKTALNLTATSVQDRSLEGFQYNLSLGDVLWNPHAVRAELESRFGFDDLHVEKLLSYTAQLTEIPTGETLEQFVCSALSSVPENEANKENNEEGCISAWHEAKLYLVHAVSKLRLYAQVLEQWFSSSLSQKLLLELERIIADLMYQFLDDREARKLFSEINTLIQQWNEKSDAYFSEGYTASHDLILHLERMQSVLQDVPQWPVMKRLLLVDGAIRNVIAQYLYFTEEALRSLEKLIPFAQRGGFIHLDIRKLFVELGQMLMSNASYICNDMLTMFEKTLRLPRGSDDIDILATYMCPGNGSEVTFKLSNQVQSLKESVLLLQKVTQGQQSLPDSIMDDYLGWQEIEEQLTENYAYYCEINQLLSTEAPSEDDVHFSSCQEQLLFSLINTTLEEILFAFEENPYWKDLTTFVSWTCEVAQYMNEVAGSTEGQSGGLEASLCSRQKLSLETILGHYLAFLQELPDYSSFISWARILTSFKEFLKREENLWVSGEKEMDHLFHLVEIIEEIIMLDFSASSNQSLIKNVLNNTIMWMKNFAEGKKSATNFSLEVSELHNELRKNFQPLQRFWMKEKTEFFWHIVKIVFYELDSRLSHLSQVEEEEVWETLSRIVFSITENKIRNRSMLLLQNILTDWPELNIAALNHLKHLSENFLRNLYEVRSLTDDHVNMSFSTIHGVSNASSLLLSNVTFIYKVQTLGEIVHDFFKNIQKLNSTSVASLVPILFSLYQNDDLVLNIESNSTLLTFLYETSKDISSFQVWHDFQDRDRVFDFLSETFDLLWNFTSKSLCEKLLIVYNYTEFQAQSLAEKGKKEMQVVYSTLSSLKTLFIDEEVQTAAFCYLEQFLDISPECLVNNGCIDFYLSNISSVDDSVEVYNLLLLPLDSVLSNITNLGDKVSVPSALRCTFTWLQTWTEIFEEASKILNLNSTFFVCLRNDLANLSESLLNTTHDELCNNTAMVFVEATTAAMNLLKIIFEGDGDLNDWKDFEAFLANLQSVFNNAADVTSSLKGNSLESVLEVMGVMITELQKSMLKVVNGDFLNSWLDTFISGGAEGEDRSAGVFSIGNSLSTILKLSQKELGIILTEIKDTTAFFKSVPQGKYMLSLVELLAEIPVLLKNKTFEIQENSSSHLDIEIELFLHEKNTSLLMEFFQYVISELDSDLRGEHKTFLQKLIEAAALNTELVRKALNIFKSSSFTGFPLRDDKGFLKHMVALVQNMRSMDVEFLISQFKHVQRILDNFFKNIKPLYIENSELGMLTDLWDAFENNLCNWNLTGLWQITQIFEQDELYDVEEMFRFLLNVISLTEKVAHGNITEALTEVYAFILTQEAKMPMFTEEEFSNQVESLLMLLETLTDMSDEPAEASVCFSAAFCWTLTTATPQTVPTFKPCDFVHSNSTLSYNAVIEVIKELKLITLEDSSSCTMEDFQMDITRNLTCFFYQIKEWNSILLKFSELHHVNGSVLKELLDFWNELSLYAVPLQVNNTYSVNCSSTLKRQVALQIVETLGSMPVAEMEMAKGVLEQLDDLYGGLSWNRHSKTSLIKTVLTNVKNMTSEVSGLLDTEAVLSFLSVIQPLMMLSSVGNQTYSMLMILSALNGNSNISDNFENFWFPIVTSIEDLLVNFNVRHLLAVIDQEFQLLRLATGQSSSMALDALIQQFNTSSVDAILRNFEDIQEIVNSFLCECNNKNYSKIMHALILLMANENSSTDLMQVVKDIIDFLELFQNKSKEDYAGVLFVDGHLSREKLNNTRTANSVLLNSLLHVIADLTVIEEALHTNNTELQIVDFIDSFFDNAQYREVSTQSQNRNLDIMQEILQMIFQSTTGHDRNKITFLLKDLHKDIMAEMSAFLVALTGRCDEELLSLLLKLPENSKTSLVVEELCSLPALDLYTMFVLIIQNLNLRHIVYKIKIPSEIGIVLNMLLDVVSSISSLLNKAHHVMENLPVFLQGVQDIGVLDMSALQQFLQGGQFRSSAVGSLKSVIKAVCKEESSFFSNANLFIDMPRIMGVSEDNMAKYGIPEDSTPFCLKLYKEILQSSNGALLWTFLKPLLHGKILYNSNINMIDLVMEKANFTFGSVENLKTYSETWLRMSEVFKTSGNVLTVSRLQEALQSNFIKHFIESNLDIDVEKLFKKMQVYDPAPPSWKGPCIEGATIGVVLLSLTKEHVDGQKAAVKDLSLTFHRGQITALLGPNGAGKTTVISLLTGLYPPSSGTIIINGKDIRTDLAAIRTELGVCPQYDVLFNVLTVREHLLLYGSVKAPGWTKEQLNQQVSGALEDVDLSQHQYKTVGALSGGMKRRLSIAISFIGNSKTVVLDEPTSGLDPCSRRSIWDVLLKYKSGCTLIFTTHHLDEAEVLSDRIAILQRGQLRCCGSPSYLRETYGQGHSLKLIKKPSVFEIQDPKHIVRVTSLVQTHIPEAFLKENSGTELTYVIPERADKTSLKGLFQALDQSLHHLHVTGYGISDTSLEEVFLKLLQDSEKMPCVPQAAHLDHTNGVESAYISLTGASSVCGARLVLAQIVALLMKRFHHTRRDWRGILSNVLLPVLFVALAMALFSVKPLAIDYPSLKLTPRLYDNVESFFRKNNSCWQMESTSPQDSCGCVAEQKMCPNFSTSAPYVKNKKGHILYNLSGFLVEEYLVRPSNKARYGGWSFGGRKAFELQDTKLNNTKSKPPAKVWYNQKGFHSLPSYLNELNNFILWLNLPPNVDWKQYGITLYSQPYGGALLDEDKIMENVRQCGVALCIMLGFSILTASIGSAIVKDRVSGTKRLQHITGLGYKTYWLANFYCDMLFYMVPVILCVSVITAFQLSAFTFRKNLAATVLLLILFGGQCSVNSMVSPSEDVDVEMERQRLFGGRTGNDVLLLYNLRKCYGGFSKKNTAVESISLGIPRGETCCYVPVAKHKNSSEVNFSVLKSEMDILSASSEGIVIGYCPQQDALDELLTGWEHLYYYCTLRGIPKQDIHKDEPSSGMDPCSKRYLWKTILKEVQDGCAAVLTSHSMEECEALCTRLAIMVNGSFKCLGSPQHIKNRYHMSTSNLLQLHSI